MGDGEMNAFQDRHPLKFQAICALARVAGLSMLITVLVSLQAQADTPTIRLFPTTGVEDLRQTSSVARELESGLQEVIGRLDQQQPDRDRRRDRPRGSQDLKRCN